MMKLIQVADLHFGRECKPAITAAISAINSLQANALIVAGDLTQRGKTSEFEAARDWLSQISLPQIVVPGNHDTPMLNLYARAHEPFKRFCELFGEDMQTLKFPDLKIVGLNTARGWQVRRNWAEGSVNLDDLQDALGDTPELKALVCHHPLRPVPGAPLTTRTKRGARASQAIAKSNVRMLFTGHVHQPAIQNWREEGGQYLAIGAGTLSDRLREWPPSFNEIQLNNGQVQVIAHAYEGTRFVPRKLGTFTL